MKHIVVPSCHTVERVSINDVSSPCSFLFPLRNMQHVSAMWSSLSCGRAVSEVFIYRRRGSAYMRMILSPTLFHICSLTHAHAHRTDTCGCLNWALCKHGHCVSPLQETAHCENTLCCVGVCRWLGVYTMFDYIWRTQCLDVWTFYCLCIHT